MTSFETGVAGAIVPHPPPGTLLFHPGAEGPEHHGSVPPPEDPDPVFELSEEPNSPKIEKLGVVHVMVLAVWSTEQPLSATHAPS